MNGAHVMDAAIVAVATLETEKATLISMLTKLHHDAFVYITDLDQDEQSYRALMLTMSESRALIRKLGGAQ